MGLVEGDVITLRLPDGSTVRRRLALGLRLESHGHNAECRAILEPGRSVPLVGQSFLEAPERIGQDAADPNAAAARDKAAFDRGMRSRR